MKRDGKEVKGGPKVLVFDKGRIATLHFIEKEVGGRKVVVGKLGADDVWPEDPRFTPKAGDAIECSVMSYEKKGHGGRGTRTVQKCLPHFPDELRLNGRWRDWEAIPPELVRLVFRKQPRRDSQGDEIVAFCRGQLVVPEKGHVVPLGVEHEYMRYYDSRRRCWVAYQARQFVAEKGLAVKLGEKAQDITVLVRGELRTCYDLLGVKPTASEREIQKAYRAKILACHGDKIESLGDPDLKAIAMENTKALNEARDKALAVLGKLPSSEATPKPDEADDKAEPVSPSAKASGDKQEKPVEVEAAATAPAPAPMSETTAPPPPAAADEAPKPAKTTGESESQVEKFNRRYTARTTGPAKPKGKPTKKTPAEAPAKPATMTLAEQLAAVAKKLG